VLNVANLTLKDMPWVAFYCKERDINITGMENPADDMKRVVECIKGEKGLGERKCVCPENLQKFRWICGR